MKVAPAIATIVALVLLLSWFSWRAVNPEAELFDRALAELNRFGMIENALSRDIFTARAGMLRNYDPLVDEVGALRDSLQRLSDICAIDSETADGIARLVSSVDSQEEMVEHFKTENALLRNSLAFFGRFGAQALSPDLDPAISATAAAILHLALDTSSATVHDVQDRLDELEQQAAQNGQGNSVEALLAHGRLLNSMLPSVDNTLKTMRRLPLKQDEDTFRKVIVAKQLATRASARRFRAMLYTTSLALVGFLVYFGIRLKAHADALQRRAAFEHIVTGISMRFIDASPQTLDAEIDRALAEMAAFTGSDRAYFTMSGAVPRFHLWHKPGAEPPLGWPARAPELAARIGGGPDGVFLIPCVHQMPDGRDKASCLDFGLGGWACVTAVESEGVAVALGFDTIGRSCRIAQASELALLRMALDTIVRAVERHAMEAERKRLETRLQQARRMERIGVFTSGIAHNFNNILGGIIGHSEVMEDNIGSNAKLAHNLGGIRRGAERARDLVDQIMLFGRRRHADRKPMSVGALTAEAASLLDVSLPANIELVIRQLPVAAIVSGEQAQLQQVLLNLCKNAANAMPHGGRIEVAIEMQEVAETRPLSHDEIRPGHYVCIVVTDTGQGMDEATLGRIFEPFFTTRPSGNGFGLATVREIVREHGGALNVHSEIGKGSRFEIWLPRVAATSIPEPAAPGLPTGSGETVMLVALDNGRLLRDEETLAVLGYEPIGFNSADAALAACRANPDRFDMAVVGHLGSSAASLKLAAALHAATPHLPILLAAKAAIEIGTDTLVAAGILDVVNWPIVAEEIAVTLAHGPGCKKAGGSRRRPDAERRTALLH